MKPFPYAHVLVPAVFCAFAAATVAGAVIAAGSRRVIRGVCGLAMCCVGLAGLFYFLQSPFLALMEILIYVGAICVTIIFVVMLAEPEEAASSRARSRAWTGAALAVSVAAFAGLSWLGTSLPAPRSLAAGGDGSVKAIGVSLLTTYSMAFELISVLLLVAIIGALVLTRSGRDRP
ncbi:MAG: NADH-quinone oxidoreductase subunit J [Planctomycetota bacterium]